MNKTEAKKRAKELIERAGDLIAELIDIQAEIGDLRDECQEVVDYIKPYENRNELTPQQEERQMWFKELVEHLDECAQMDIEDAFYNAEDFLDY